jgi:hypothetical protein
MKMANLVLGLVAISIAVSQHAEAQVLITRVYYGNDFENYSLDPPFWSYHSTKFWHSKSGHWLYGNHHYVFIDIKLTSRNNRSAKAKLKERKFPLNADSASAV